MSNRKLLGKVKKSQYESRKYINFREVSLPSSIRELSKVVGNKKRKLLELHKSTKKWKKTYNYD